MNSEQMPARRLAVIGGGMTGLAAAHRLIELANQSNQSIEVTLFEGLSLIHI